MKYKTPNMVKRVPAKVAENKKEHSGNGKESTDSKSEPRIVPLAILNPTELEQAKLAKLCLQYKKNEYDLMIRGVNALWFGFQQRYKLPDEIDVNYSTGELFPKSKESEKDKK